MDHQDWQRGRSRTHHHYDDVDDPPPLYIGVPATHRRKRRRHHSSANEPDGSERHHAHHDRHAHHDYSQRDSYYDRDDRDDRDDRYDEAEDPAEPHGHSDLTVSPAAERLRQLLAEEDSIPTPTLFTEMDTLQQDGDELEWKESARWVKFEEKVEEGGERWSKPHVSTLTLHSLFELRTCLQTGSILLDLEGFSLPQIVDEIVDRQIADGLIGPEVKDKISFVLLRKHRHQTKKAMHRSLADIGKPSNPTPNRSPQANLSRSTSTASGIQRSTEDLRSRQASSLGRLHPAQSRSMNDISDTPSTDQLKNKFMKKIPRDAEASNVLIGEVDFLEKPFVAFVRLAQATTLGGLTEVPVPTRFLFILLGPRGKTKAYNEIGRAIATLMVDDLFSDVAYKARDRDDLIAGVDEFLDEVIVLPPGEWDPKIRIEPPKKVPSAEMSLMDMGQPGPPDGGCSLGPPARPTTTTAAQLGITRRRPCQPAPPPQPAQVSIRVETELQRSLLSYRYQRPHSGSDSSSVGGSRSTVSRVTVHPAYDPPRPAPPTVHPHTDSSVAARDKHTHTLGATQRMRRKLFCESIVLKSP
ncbi:electrogenic sodium bicarbonate cotransporter 4-like [Gadus macrocephalus]|uniref:electrogenic sodium bicarbonate cotransporter 4-like n=1 Tax=Gadus macrocephalus TaxID=80720 RepID=UPI0028CB41E0|nr:electrogenic sodium bicarbonate cotransporter 4-like [Gadus macrocephalus]